MSDDLPDLAEDAQRGGNAIGQSGNEVSFGVLTLRVADGAGYLALPKDISPPVLKALREALLAGLERCSGVTLDMGAVTRCDVFFHQLLLAAKSNYSRCSKRLMATGALAEDLRAACRTQGFEVDASGCVLPVAPSG
jgi:hypothetical protein